MEPVPAPNLLLGSGTVPTRELGDPVPEVEQAQREILTIKKKQERGEGVDFSFYLVILVSRK